MRASSFGISLGLFERAFLHFVATLYVISRQFVLCFEDLELREKEDGRLLGRAARCAETTLRTVWQGKRGESTEREKDNQANQQQHLCTTCYYKCFCS